MTFIKEKADFLLKKDKSRKGSIDTKIKKLVEKINSSDNYFTTSSCAGRILLLTQPESNKKEEVQYLFCSHSKINFSNIKKILKQRNSTNLHIGGMSSAQKPPVNWWNSEYQRPRNVIVDKNMPPVYDGWFLTNKKLPKEDVWFRVESAILHIACKDTESALKLLKIAREVGFRRSGIISLGKNRATIELVSTEKIDTIIAKKGKIIIDSDYLKILIDEGNKKLEKAWGKIEKLQNKLK